MAVNWPSGVNHDFYGMQTSSVENIEETEFESGKIRTFLKNSSSKKTHTLNFILYTRSEEKAFWTWYDNVLLSRSENFYMFDLLNITTDVKEYRMTAEPSIPDSQYPKECQISVVEE